MNKLLPFVLLTLSACGADFRSPVKAPPPPSAAAMQSKLDTLSTGVYSTLWILYDQTKLEDVSSNKPLQVSFAVYASLTGNYPDRGAIGEATNFINISTSEIMEYDGPPLVEIYRFDNRNHLKVWLPSAHECQQ
jgi:hypothetical protein